MSDQSASPKKISGLPPRESKRAANGMENQDSPFTDALKKISTASAASSRAAIQASKATKPSRHTRFVYDPVKGRG